MHAIVSQGRKDLLARVDSALLRNLSTIDAAPPLLVTPSWSAEPLDLPPVRLSAPSKVDTMTQSIGIMRISWSMLI